MKYFALILLLVTLIKTVLIAQDGELDLTFGTSGIIRTAIGTRNASGKSIAIQADGKIVVAGHSYNGNDYDFAIVRYNTEGTIDSSFGSGGIVTTEIGTGDDFGRSIAIQSDGKIVVVGTSTDDIKMEDFAVLRYNWDGTLDSLFGNEGIVTTDIGTNSNDYAYDVAIQSDGKIVVAGNSRTGLIPDFAGVRYNIDGSLDNSFGNLGKVTTDVQWNNYARCLAIQTDGKILVGGYSEVINGLFGFALVRYNINGTLDNSFGSDGRALVNIRGGCGDYCYNIAIQSDDKIVLCGKSCDGPTGIEIWSIGLTRLNYDGTLDESFGQLGRVSTNFGSDRDVVSDIVIQSDGKIIVAGYSAIEEKFNYNKILVVRYNTDGTIDNSFGNYGKVTTDYDSVDIESYSIALQSDNKIVITGELDNSNIPSKSDIFVARYNIPSLTNVDQSDIELQNRYKLFQNYPNPFNPSTTIEYSIPSSSVISNGERNLKDSSPFGLRNDKMNVSVKVYDILGREVATLVNQMQKSGIYEVKFDAANLSSGMYFYTLKVNEFAKINKMIYLK